MQINPQIAPKVLVNKLALVTGAGQGNGRAIARGLAQAGAKVIVTDIQGLNADAVAEEIKLAGGKAWSFVLDVTSELACKNLAHIVNAEIGPIDVLVNNAGIIIREGIDSPKALQNLERMMDVNVLGTFIPRMLFCQHCERKEVVS